MHHPFCAPSTGRNLVAWGPRATEEAWSLQPDFRRRHSGRWTASSSHGCFELAAHSSLTPPKLFSLRPALIILPATPCRPPSSTLPSFTAENVAKQCSLPTPHPRNPYFPFSPSHLSVWSLLSTKTTVLRVTGDLHVATSRRHFQPHPPANGHVRLSRTLWYLWVENFVVGTVTMSLSHSTVLARPLL